jgi:autotransporter-associated beta strand protein
LGQNNRRSRFSREPNKKFRRRAFLEALEARQVLTVPVPPEGPVFPDPLPDHHVAHIREGWLFISSAFSAEHNNKLTISTDEEGAIYIRDAELPWQGTGGILGAELSPDGRTLKVPSGAITGHQILINGGLGNDDLTLDFSGGNPIPLGGLKFNGGDQTSATGDAITLIAGSVESVDYVFVNENDGSITVDGRTIEYVGLEPVNDVLLASTRSFTFTGAAETITISDPTPGDNSTRIDSTLGELVDFTTPTASLRIITNGGDTTNINAFDSSFNTQLLSLEGTTSNNTYNLGSSNVIPDTTALSLTGNVTFNMNGNSDTIASLASTDTTPSITLSTGSTLTVGDTTTTTYSGAFTGAGALIKEGTGTLILSGASGSYTGVKTINAGVLRINQGNSGGTGSTVINNGGVFEINNVTHDAPISLNHGGTLRGLGTSARENGVITLAASAAVNLEATAGTTLTLSNGGNDLTGGAGSTITVAGGGVVALTQTSNAGSAANPVRWRVVDNSVLSISTDGQLGTNPSAATADFLTLDGGTLRNVSTTAFTLATNRGITLGSNGGTILNASGAQNLTYGGRFSGANPLNVIGSIGPALVLNGPSAANEFSELNIDGTRVFTNNAINSLGGASGTAPIRLTNGAQFGLVSNANLTINNPIIMASGTKIVSRATGNNSLVLAGPVTFPTSGTVIFNAESTANGLINMTNPANAVELTGDLTIQVGPNSAGPGRVNINHVISGPFGIIKTGTGVAQLSGLNTYTGITVFEEGILNATTITNYGVPGSLGARTLAQETAAGNGIGLLFRGGTLQYTGSTAMSTDRQIRVSTAGGTIDASGSVAAATLSFTHSGPNINWFETPGERTLTLTGTNTGLNTFAQQITNQSTNLTHVTKTGAGRWVLSNTGSTYTGITSLEGGILNVTALTDYGVPGPLGARTLAEESPTGNDIGLVFRGGTLQYTGSTPQSTNRQIRGPHLRRNDRCFRNRQRHHFLYAHWPEHQLV